MRISLMCILFVVVQTNLVSTIKYSTNENNKAGAISPDTPRIREEIIANTSTVNREKRILGYPHSHNVNYFSGQSSGYANGATTAFAQRADHISQYPYGGYPNYYEPPEPIIEIIIKDSNESLPTAAPLNLVKKKKKEKIHVFYVNYKKDENNKLHLESPIESINNDSNEDEEEEEEIEYQPANVTPLPQIIQSTTLRTIIHPDSEKYHSNSGIHVTFGSPYNHDPEAILEEHNAESVQRQVVALPAAHNVQHFQNANRPLFVTPQPAAYQPMPQAYQSSYQTPGAIKNKNLPASAQPSYQSNYQSQTALNNKNSPASAQPSYQSNYQSQTALNNKNSPASAQPSYQSNYQSQTALNNKNSPASAQPSYQSNYQSQTALNNKNSPASAQPTYQTNYQPHSVSNSKNSQPLAYNGSNGPYRSPASAPAAATASLQQFSAAQHTKNVQSSVSLRNSQDHQNQYNRHGSYQNYNNYNTQYRQPPNLPTKYPQTQYEPVKFRPTTPPVGANIKDNTFPYKLDGRNQAFVPQRNSGKQPSPLYFNRQPQHIQQPSFSLVSPTQPPTQPPKIINTTNGATRTPERNSPSTNSRPLTAINQNFGAPTFQNTELFKSIPKFEQHITETINLPSSQRNSYDVAPNVDSRSQVIHNIPAPDLSVNTQQYSQPQYQSHTYANANNQNNGAIGVSSYENQKSVSHERSTSGQSQSQYQQQQHQKQLSAEQNQKVMIVTPVPVISNDNHKHGQFIGDVGPASGSHHRFSVSTHHADVFRELEQKQHQQQQQQQQQQEKQHHEQHQQQQQQQYQQQYQQQSQQQQQKHQTESTTTTTTPKPSPKALAELPAEVPDDLRQQLLTSGILDNADISVLDYDKVGDIDLKNLPAEHLQHFYSAGGDAYTASSSKSLNVVSFDGHAVNLNNNGKPISKKTFKSLQKTSNSNNYKRYVPLKINGSRLPIPATPDLKGHQIVEVVVLAPITENRPSQGESVGEQSADVLQFLRGDLLRVLLKEPSAENFKNWLDDESHIDINSQAVVLLVTRDPPDDKENIFMYDISSGTVKKLKGELSTAFVKLAEENAVAEYFNYSSTIDTGSFNNMLRKNADK